ncbi:MAG TPA: aldolase [Candidatus Dormibacteraeota bacterium]|nr:aldolase [Candidatus Dormibacteraeota bacterium]
MSDVRERELRAELVATAAFLFARGYSHGSAGNLSARCGERILITPTGGSLSDLTPESIAAIDLRGQATGAARPSKEAPFHLAAYRTRADCGAVVHLHSHYSVALSCLAELDERDALPPLTPYYVMRVGRVPTVPYFPPGDERLGAALAELAAGARAMLMRNHGLIALGRDLRDAADVAQELEAHARLFFELAGRGRPLTPEQVAELHARFAS